MNDAATTASDRRGFLDENWHEVETAWPLRLLHIPSMTSIQRTGESTYGVDKQPRYATLTYTWGRFRAEPGSPALGIKGTTWTIPPVKEAHFTVEAFGNVITEISKVVDHAWIDVACIDQENRAVKMSEIGRQAAIFMQAHCSFVWLNYHTHDALQRTLDDVFDLRNVMSVSTPRTTMLKRCQILSGALASLFSDPWFSSLWTLQEAVLRKDAKILSCDARPVTLRHDRNRQIHIENISNLGWNLTNTMGLIMPTSLKFERLGKQIQEILEESGFAIHFLSNPNVSYGAAAYRTTKHPLDRVYGIMQVYGFRLGESARPDIEVTMAELEEQLGEALVNKSPLLAQMFVHTREPAQHKSWMITQHSRVPQQWQFYTTASIRETLKCRMSITANRTALITGRSCSFAEWAEDCSRRLRSEGPMGLGHCYVALDELSHIIPNVPSGFYQGAHAWLTDTTCSRLQKKFGKENLRLFLLGRLRENYGVILLRRTYERLWQRVGVATWPRDREMPTMIDFEEEIH